jgi:hypothetical protein
MGVGKRDVIVIVRNVNERDDIKVLGTGGRVLKKWAGMTRHRL